jgi:hypothetical protein
MLIRVSLGSKSCILQLALKGDIPQDSHSIKTDISTNAYTRKSLPYSFKTLNAGASYFPGSKWKTGLRQYPMFAEYTNGQSSDGLNGLSDTGLTMRAFLPISNPQTRSSIHSYEGLSTVVDARVACVRPNITNLWLQINSTDRLYEDLILSGDMFIPTDLLDTAASSRIFPTTPYHRFACEISKGIVVDNTARFLYHHSDWKLSICQLWRGAGILVPEFLETNISYRWDLEVNNYLLLNLSSNHNFSYPSWPNKDFTFLEQVFDNSTPGLVYQNKNDWLEVSRKVGSEYAKMNFSLCFPAMTSRSFNISASSKAPAVEPTYTYVIRVNKYDSTKLEDSFFHP